MSTLKPQPPCPECEKLAAVSDQSNQIGAFLKWLFVEGDTPYYICQWDDTYGGYYSTPLGDTGINKLLAKYFEIDLDKVEQERRALLDWLREVQS